MLQKLLGFCPADRWTEGTHAIVWPENRLLCERTEFSLAQVRQWLDRLFDRSIIAIFDDANGQRRNSLDPITKAPRLLFGIRLSPLIHQYDTFLEISRGHQEARRDATPTRSPATSAARSVAFTRYWISSRKKVLTTRYLPCARKPQRSENSSGVCAAAIAPACKISAGYTTSAGRCSREHMGYVLLRKRLCHRNPHPRFPRATPPTKLQN